MTQYKIQGSNSNAIHPTAPSEFSEQAIQRVNTRQELPLWKGLGGGNTTKRFLKTTLNPILETQMQNKINASSILYLHLKLAFEFINLQVWRLTTSISLKSRDLQGLTFPSWGGQEWVSKIVLILLTFLHFHTTQAQQIFPVQVSGTIIPPYSSLLSDYSDARSQDLIYTLTLNDPIEASRNVYFRITIISNGQEIMTTNPNFIPSPFQLLQFTPTMVTGAELAAYLQPQNLISLRGGQATNALPDGFNQICLEVMDFERQIPISQQVCRGGLVRRLEPPLIEIPQCGEALQVAPQQPIMFRWVPRHLGLPNTPPIVDYEFTLVKLLPGIADPNDGFDFAIQILQTNLTTPTFIYDERFLPLEDGTWYAWRVRVKDPAGSNLFDNNGYSQVCSFLYLEDRTLGTAGIRNMSCAPLSTEYRMSQNSGFVSEDLNDGDNVQLGFFNLEVLQSFKTGNGYMGLGHVYVAFLKAHVKIMFEGLKVDRNNQVYEVGEAKAVGDLVYVNSSNLSIRNIRNELTLEMAQELDVMLKNPIEKIRMVNERDESDEIPIGLPLVMDRLDRYGNAMPKVVILDMRFTEKEGKLTAFSWLQKKTGRDDFVLFGGTSIGFTPYGISRKASLSLFSPLELVLKNKDKILLKANKYNQVGTRMKISCEGFEVFNLEGDYHFYPRILRPIDSTQPFVSVPLSTEANHFFNFEAKIKNMPAFQLANLPNHTFRSEKVVANYNNLRPLETDIFMHANYKYDVNRASKMQTSFNFPQNTDVFGFSVSKARFQKCLKGGKGSEVYMREALGIKGDLSLDMKDLQLQQIQTHLSAISGEYYKLIFNDKKANVRIGNKRFPISEVKVKYITPYNRYFRAGEVGWELIVLGENNRPIKIAVWSSEGESGVMEVSRIEVDGQKGNELKASY